MDNPTPSRLANWRTKAQQAAAEQAGFACHAYAQTKFTAIIDRLARLTHAAAPQLASGDTSLIYDRVQRYLADTGRENLANEKGGASAAAVAFFRAHDVGFRIRRLQLLARKLSRDWERDPDIPDDALDLAREHIYAILNLYQQADRQALNDPAFLVLAAKALERPGAALNHLAETRLLRETDVKAEELLSEALAQMPKNLRQRMLLTYLGFPYYDIATLPLHQRDTLDEFNPALIDRISPEDALSIREGGTNETLRGIEFYNFGAFFCRSYREYDYLWGRLHGAERMIDITASTVEEPLDEATLKAAKRSVFLAVLKEEREAGRCSRDLIETLRREVEERLPTAP